MVEVTMNGLQEMRKLIEEGDVVGVLGVAYAVGELRAALRRTR
jgi:hypothetical protein